MLQNTKVTEIRAMSEIRAITVSAHFYPSNSLIESTPKFCSASLWGISPNLEKNIRVADSIRITVLKSGSGSDFHFSSDRDPDHQCDMNLRPLVYRASMAPFPWLRFEPPRLHCELNGSSLNLHGS